MSRIPQPIIDRIISEVNIVSEIGDDISLRKRGVNYVGLCPFHNDHDASLYVNPVKGIYKCFACGEGGNVITFRQKFDNLKYPEAVRYLGKKHNIDVPTVELTPEEKQHYDELESTRVVITKAQAEFARNLDSTAEALAYVTNRGISPETIATYGLGYAFDFNGLSKKLTEQGCKQKYIIAADVAQYNEEKHQLRDTFWKRIMFPFYDRRGQVVGFTGRAINDQPAKYKNTGETILFTKGKNIFGLYQARNEIKKQDKVYIVEGQFDVLSFYEVGLKNAIAGSGTAFTEDQRKLLHGYTQNVVFVYDGDGAGIHAAVKHLPELIHDGFHVRCLPLPKGQDPNDMLKSMKSGFKDYVEKAEVGYVEYLYANLLAGENDHYKRMDAIKAILSVIAHERDAIVRGSFLGTLSQLAGVDLQQLQQLANEQAAPVEPSDFKPGFYGLDLVEDIIKTAEDPEVHLIADFGKFSNHICKNEPYVFYYGVPDSEAITSLLRICDHVVAHSPNTTADKRGESNDLLMLKELYRRGLTIDVTEDGETEGFIYYYIRFYGSLIKTEAAVEVQNDYYARCAELISYAKESIQTINIPTWATMLHIKKGQLQDILKPFVNERKSSKKMQREKNYVSSDLVGVDSETLPDYVTENETLMRNFQRYGFYPVIRKSDGTPVCYMFRTENNTFRRVADFYIEPLFHVYASNKDENRRVIKLNRMYIDKPTYVEWPSSVFAKLTTVQEMLINEGAYNFENGTAQDYAKIWNCISYHFPKCTEIKVFGQQPEDCFCFSNGIFHYIGGEWKYEGVDELGLMHHGDDIFYSPAFSKVNAGVRKDNDRFEQDKWLIYTDTPATKRISFERWAQLMDSVYAINNNGKWALLYAILCAFRSDVFPLKRIFTAPFFIGPTMSGKTQIAVSIRSLFIKPEAPSFNLNSGTDAAFFSILERFRDVPQIMEEYNDEMISDQKFQGLKSTIYDGESKQKRKSASSNEVEASKVHAPIILLGQESPQKDDNALTNRVILCEVPKSDAINTEHAQQIFEELKEAEHAGLSYLLIDVLKLRPIVREHYADLYKVCSRELQNRVEASGTRSGEQARLINTVSLLLTLCKLMETYAPHLPLPFSYNEFLHLAVEKVNMQIATLVETDKLAVFFTAVDTLIDQGIIKRGRDYKIETPGKLAVKGGEDIVLGSDQRVLYMNLSNIHNMYVRSISKENKPLSFATLNLNLKSHPAYLGFVQSTRFRWDESVEQAANPDEIVGIDGQTIRKNMTMVRVMQSREKNTSAVALDYDKLRQLVTIDFERTPAIVEDSSTPSPTRQDDKLPF